MSGNLNINYFKSLYFHMFGALYYRHVKDSITGKWQ